MIKRVLLFLITLCLGINASAQQAKEEKRCQSVLLFPEYVEATIKQPFGRSLKAKANIWVKDGSLIYIDEKTKKPMRAYMNNIIGVDFCDSLHYMRVNDVIGRVVAQKGYNYLLRVTHVNMAQYREETDGGKGMDNFTVELPSSETFLALDTQERDDEKGIPLVDTYYFNICGTVIKANETEFKNFVTADQKQAFKVLKENRFWSWTDEESLKMLLDFLPEK